MTTGPHPGCVVEARNELREARRAFLAHRAVAGAALTSPREDPTDRWTLELSILTGPESPADGFAPSLMDLARLHGLTMIDCQPRHADEWRAVLMR